MKIMCEPLPDTDANRVTFEGDEDDEYVVVTVGEKTLPALTIRELTDLYIALRGVIAYDFSGDAESPRAEEPGQEVPAG